MDTLQKILSLIAEKFPSDKAFEDALGIPSKTVNNWKRGVSKSYLKMVPQIASLFGVTTDYLLGSELQKQKTPREELAELPNVYYRLAQGVKDLNLSDHDVDLILGIAREVKEQQRRNWEAARGKKKRKNTED